MKILPAAAAAVAVAAFVSAACAFADWVVPVGGEVGFDYTGGGGQTVTITFDASCDAAGYEELCPPAIELSADDWEEYALPSAQMCIYDDDPSMPCFFGGWYTLPGGGERVEDVSDIASMAEGGVTLYARWRKKAEVRITLQDYSNFYDISFVLTCGGTEHVFATSAQGEAAVTAYLRADGDWSAAVACGSAQASFSPAEAALNDGSHERTVRARFLQKAGAFSSACGCGVRKKRRLSAPSVKNRVESRFEPTCGRYE